MELRHLHSFRTVVREGSFTAAAKALHMTQPTVSLHVKALEDETGSRLLERDTRGVTLTAAGRVLLEAAEVVLGRTEDALRRIREMEEPERGTLTLACGDTVALGLLPPILAAFRRQRPLAEVVIDYSVKTYFTKGVLKTNFWRLSWGDRVRMLWRALARRVRPG